MVYKKCLHNSTQIASLTSEYQSSENYNCNEVPFKLLACGTCYQCVAVNWEFGVGDEDIEDALTRNVKAEGAVSDGWHLAKTARDRQRHLMLNFGIYRVNESAQHADFEADFDVPNEAKDTILLAWHGNRAVGFSTLKTCSETVVIDSIFVRKSFRRQGLATALILYLLEPTKDSISTSLLGLSQPISTSMLLVTLDVLKKHPDHRKRVVIIDESSDDFGNLWWSAMKICKDRKISWR